jgi:hypothetical protein
MLDAVPTPEDVLGGPLPPTVWLIILALAATRVAGLLALDTILDRPRMALTEAASARRGTAWVETLVTCMWCVGVWVAAAAVASTIAAAPGNEGGALFDWVLIGLAVAQVTGMLSGTGRK